MDIVDHGRLILPPIETAPGAPARSRPPGIAGYLALGDLTIVFGANDTGKSRLLRQLEDTLSWRERWWKPGRGDFFAPDGFIFLAIDEEEARWLAEKGNPSRDERNETCLEVIAVASQGERDGDQVRVEPNFILHRCNGSGLNDSAEWPLGKDAPGDLIADHSVHERPAVGDDLIELELSVLPVPVRLPTDELVLLGGLVETLGRWKRALGLFSAAFELAPPGPNRPPRDYGLPEGFVFHPHQAHDWALKGLADMGGEVTPEREWMSDGRAVAVSKHVERGLCFIEDHANAALPGFVSERYRISAHLAQMTSWEARGPVTLGLTPRAADSVIPLAEVADGLQLWVQLAVAEGVDRLREATGGLLERWLSLSDDLDTANGALADLQWGPRDDDGVERVMGRARAIANAAHDPAAVTRAGLGLKAMVHAASAARSSQRRQDESRPPGDPALVRDARGSLYLLDEPERHLNPRLQREAARHLEALMTRSRSQAIVVTHSPAFLSAAPGARLARIDRLDERSDVRPMSPAELTATSALAEDLGFDRGELLTNTRLLLAVEGPADRAVMEARYGPELRAAGVVIAPLGGIEGQRQLLEMDVLVRYCAQRVAVMFDNTAADDVRQVMVDPEFRRKAFDRNSRRELGLSDELVSLAWLVDRLEERERVVHPVPFDVPDLLQALDEDCIQMTLAAGAPQVAPYPGHVKALEEFANRTAAFKRAGFKEFLRRSYGLDTDARSLGAIARNMRSLERTTEPLAMAFAEILRLAGEA